MTAQSVAARVWLDEIESASTDPDVLQLVRSLAERSRMLRLAGGGERSSAVVYDPIQELVYGWRHDRAWSAVHALAEVGYVRIVRNDPKQPVLELVFPRGKAAA